MRYFHTEHPRYFHGEHPVTAVVAVIAIVLAILLIAWLRYELNGNNHETYHIEGAATVNRFATGFSP